MEGRERAEDAEALKDREIVSHKDRLSEAGVAWAGRKGVGKED